MIDTHEIPPLLAAEAPWEDMFSRWYADGAAIAAHNAETAAVWDAYRNGRPTRVPGEWGGIAPQRLLHMHSAASFKDYYLDAETCMRVQANARLLSNRLLLNDAPVTAIGAFTGDLGFHPFSDEAYWGCPITWFDRSQARVGHLHDREKVDPASMPLPDPFHGPFTSLVTRKFEAMTELAGRLRVQGVPFSRWVSADGMKITYGLFNTACQIRGSDLYLDLIDDPAYVHALLERVGEGYVQRVAAWEERTGRRRHHFIAYDHGIDMMSIEHYETFLVPLYHRVKRALGATAWDPEIEHCGRGEAVIRYKHRHFGITKFTNLNAAFLDLERLRHDLGPEVHMQVTIHPGLVHTGPVEAIHAAVRDLLTTSLKAGGPLTFGLQGDNYSAPIEHLFALYEALREYGRI